MNNLERGRDAERIAARYLISMGYRILRTNWRWGRKELDLVALHRGILVIIEVKSMHGNRVNHPWEVVDSMKQRNIVLAADAYIRRYRCRWPTRFDVMAVIYHARGVEIGHIENAFYPGVE